MAQEEIGCGVESDDDTVVLPICDYPATFRKVINGFKVDIGRLLFTAERDFLVKNNDEKVRLADLKNKTVVLFMFPLDPSALWGSDHPDMIDAYNQMLSKGPDVEFVLVPVPPYRSVQFPTLPQSPTTYVFPKPSFESPEEFFNHLFSTIPFPSVPFSDVGTCGRRVLNTFSSGCLPNWVVIDPNQQVVTTQCIRPNLFKLYGGDELYPLTPEALHACHRLEPRKQLISDWDKLLGDFVLSSNGDKVPVSSLKDKIIGLYFCESIQNPPPPRMELIAGFYDKVTSLGHRFEIVQINFHYHFFRAKNVGTDPTVEPSREGISWFTLPFKDPSCRKLQRIFNCAYDDVWDGDCLVIVDSRRADVVFEFSGAEMIEAYGVKAYPFTRHSLYETEYYRQQEELTLQSLFPPGEPLLSGSLYVDVSRLWGRRVLVLLGDESCRNYMTDLISEYKRTAGRRFEVVYVSTDLSEPSFRRGSMPWLVHRYSVDFAAGFADKVFKVFSWLMIAVATFDRHGKLTAKDRNFLSDADKQKFCRQFPFMQLDLKDMISWEVDRRCAVSKYYP